ncbi:MAG: FlgO family outer membrane protein [candidate division Zixibacteria bacterium]|nr:FlgO family outer membrane protein [candidate division Zixibacteria bacterium]
MPDSDPNDITRSHVQLAHGNIIGHYRIIEKIGSGGMGEVYLAEDTELNRKVALKFLASHLCRDADCRARFRREAQAAAKLDHPNIIQVHEVSEYSGHPFIAMQYVEGCSLKDYIAQQKLSLPRILELGMQICDGLEAAHKAGVIHRDIKPSNILIDSHGRARIVDFGLAAVRGADHLTRTGSTLGTLHYMSPEQTRGESMGEPSDIFSFGVVLYEMIAGQLPFKGEHEPAILHSIGYEEPEPLARFRAGIPDELQRIIGKMLAKQKNERYQHADDLLADLKHAASLLGSFPGLRKHRLRVVVPSIIAVGVLVLALVLKPWKFEISPTHETQASTNWLAVMYFDNITDPADSKRLGEIATNLLITGLSQSEYVKVMSSQRLYDLLKQMGKEGVKTIDRATASQIARKAEAKWMLTGSILQSEPRIVLTSQLIDVASGGVIASQRVTGNSGEDIFAVIDRLTEDVKKSSALPATVRTESSVKIADVTTHSPEAYRHYLEGLEYWNKYYNEEGRSCMHEAIEYDSTFADAYAMLAMMSDFGTPEFEKAITQAMKYVDRASDRDRQRLTSMLNALQGNYDEAIAVTRDYLVRYPDDKEFWYGLAGMYSGSGRARNSDSIIVCCNRALALDPNFRMAQNLLAYALDESGRHKEAIDAINKYIQLAPNEANPYDSRGDLYAASGKLDSALDSYQKALSIKPDFQESLKKKGYMYMFLGQYPQAENAFRSYFSNLGKPARGYWRASLTYISIYRGKFREALRIADECIAANKVDDLENTNNPH